MGMRYQAKAEFKGNLDEKVIRNILSKLAEFDIYLRDENNLVYQVSQIMSDLNSKELYSSLPTYIFVVCGISFDLKFRWQTTINKFMLSINSDSNRLYQESRHNIENFDWAWYLTIFLNITRDFKLISINTYIND